MRARRRPGTGRARARPRRPPRRRLSPVRRVRHAAAPAGSPRGTVDPARAAPGVRPTPAPAPVSGRPGRDRLRPRGRVVDSFPKMPLKMPNCPIGNRPPRCGQTQLLYGSYLGISLSQSTSLAATCLASRAMPMAQHGLLLPPLSFLSPAHPLRCNWVSPSPCRGQGFAGLDAQLNHIPAFKLEKLRLVVEGKVINSRHTIARSTSWGTCALHGGRGHTQSHGIVCAPGSRGAPYQNTIFTRGGRHRFKSRGVSHRAR